MKIKNIGLGVPENTYHCFILDIEKDTVRIAESYDLNATKSHKSTLNINQWNCINEAVLSLILKFISENDYKKNKIASKENYINTTLGKQIAVLFWGIEQTQNNNEIVTALRNWQGLTDIERCYLYTMTNANLSKDYDRGWRGAIKKILIEN